MPDIIKQPWVLAFGGVVLLAILGFALSRSSDNKLVVQNARLTSTAIAEPDAAERDPATPTGQDVVDEAGARPLTDTATDAFELDLTPGLTESGFIATDPEEECVWLVDVADDDPAKLHLVAWPAGTEIGWAPFAIRVPQEIGPPLVIDTSPMVTFEGDIRDSLSELDADETDRLLGLERCGHDAVIVIDDPLAISLE